MFKALARLERAKELLDDGHPGRAASLLNGFVPRDLAPQRNFLLAEACRQRGFFTKAERAYNAVLRSSKEPDIRQDSILGLVRALRSLGRTRPARTLLAKLQGGEISVRLERALLDRADGYYTKALKQLAALLKEYRKAGDQEGIGYLLWAMGGARRFSGDLAGAQNDFLASLAAFKKAGDSSGMGYALFGLGGNSRIRGDIRRSRDYYAAAGKAFAKTSDIFGKAYASCGLANALRQLGELAKAERLYQRSWALYSKLDDRVDLAYVDWGLGKISLQRGDLGKAEGLLRRSLGAFSEFRETRGIVLAEKALAEALHAKGRTAEAEKLFFTAVSRAKRAGIHAHLEAFT